MNDIFGERVALMRRRIISGTDGSAIVACLHFFYLQKPDKWSVSPSQVISP